MVEIVPVDKKRAPSSKTGRVKKTAMPSTAEVAQDEKPKGHLRIWAPLSFTHGCNEPEIELPE
jgi:hypothetical protein